MINVDLKSKRPIYEQIYDGMKNLILKDILSEDDQIPSVRELSGQLTINPNTIQKAYRQLERDGYIYTVRGRGNFVNTIGLDLKAQETDVLRARLTEIVVEAKLLNISHAKLKEMMSQLYKEEHND